MHDKINSDYLKTKVRVRWYSEISGTPMPGAPFIEVKQKFGSGRKKFRIEAPYSSEWLSRVDLKNPELLNVYFLLKPHAHGVLLQDMLFPAFIIQYERYRFVEPIHRVRVSVDHQISVPKINRAMVSTDYLLGPASTTLDTAVLEMKGKVEHLSGFLRYITAIGGKKSSFSKYLTCYQHISDFQM